MRFLPPSLRMRIAALTLVVGLSGGAAVFTVAPADAFLVPLIKAFTQTVSLSVKRGQTYERLEDQRDVQIQEVQQREQATQWQVENGWLRDPDAIAQQDERYDRWEQAISDRTEREKRITRDSYGRAIGEVWKEAAVSAISQIDGLDSRVRGFVTSMIRGDDPLSAALAAVTQKSAPTPDDIELLREQWASANAALRAVRIPEARQLQARLQQLLRESSGIDVGQEALDLSGIQRAADEMQSFLGQVRGTFEEWTVRGARIQPSRFQRDERWQVLAAHVAALEGSTAGRALVAGMARSTEERVIAALEAAGLDLDDDAIAIITANASGSAIAALVQSLADGDSPPIIDFETIVRDAANRWLAAAGQDPLPDLNAFSVVLSAGPDPARMGEPITFLATRAGGNEETGEFVITWTIDGNESTERSERLQTSFTGPGDHTVAVAIEDRVNGITERATQTVTVLPPFAATIGPLGLFGQVGDVFNPQPEAPLGTIFVGKIIRWTVLVDNLAPGATPQIEWRFPDGVVTDVSRGTVPPALRRDGRTAFSIDRAIGSEGTFSVQVEATDPVTGDVARHSVRVTVVEEALTGNKWHGAVSCRVEGEGDDYAFRWVVRLTPPESDDDEWFADIFFHDCPGGGRTHYRAEAIPTGANRFLVTDAPLAAGRGAMGLLAGSERPFVTFELTRGAAPSPNIEAIYSGG